MDLDPDIAIQSIETDERKDDIATAAMTPQSERHWNVNATVSNTTTNTTNTTNGQRYDSSPSRTPFRTPRTRPATPGSSSISRSPSVASIRHDRSSTPKLDKKRSVPNLTVRSTTPAHKPQFRRASSNLNPLAPSRMKAMERPQMTPVSVAKDYFSRDLQTHSRTNSEVVVFTHDACYGHRFSRPRATKAMLGSIVERPERIHATLLGASTAYVQIGERHKDARYGPHPKQEAPSPPFALVRSTRSIPLNHPAVTTIHGTKWMETLQVMCDSAEAKLAMGQKELARPIGHSRDAKGNTLPSLHSGDLYLASESLAALQGCLGGVCDAIDTVFQEDSAARRAFVCIRPPGHHCSADLPSGFCWLNNVHVGISYAAMNHGLTHAAIIDFDLHHGDGSQTIAWDHNRDANNTPNPRTASPHKKVPIGYYSLHDINSYPCEYGDEEKVRNASTCLHTAHGQSIWNVHLEPWASLADFWRLYDTKYKTLLEKAQAFLEHHSKLLRQSGIEPKAAIFLSSGFDASEWEGEGMQRHQVNVPTDFYAKFTSDVVELSRRPQTGVAGRIVSVLEGGYSDRALTSGVLSHLCGLTQGIQSPKTESQPGLGKMISISPHAPEYTYNPAWWRVDQLEMLEAMVAGHLPPPSRPKDKTPNTYSSPTQASTAKMTEVAKERTSISRQIEARLALDNAPPEPVPEVDWVVASYELSRLLIPSDRQTLSCTHEDLNAENSRVRRDRQSIGVAQVADLYEEKMQLRDRKTRQPNLNAPQPRAASKTANRRTTIAAASELPDQTMRETSRSRRRSSAASSVLSGLHDLRLEESAEVSSTRTSSRADSVVLATTDASLPLKKARAPVRTPASTVSSPRKPRAPVTSNAHLHTVKGAKPSAINEIASSVPVHNDGIDDLTNGMKKISIKLKMPTEQQHNANQKRTEETEKAKIKTSRKLPVPRASRPKIAPVMKEAAMRRPSQDRQLASVPSAKSPQEISKVQKVPEVTAVQDQPVVDLDDARSATTTPAPNFLSAAEPKSKWDKAASLEHPSRGEQQISEEKISSTAKAIEPIKYPSINLDTVSHMEYQKPPEEPGEH